MKVAAIATAGLLALGGLVLLWKSSGENAGRSPGRVPSVSPTAPTDAGPGGTDRRVNVTSPDPVTDRGASGVRRETRAPSGSTEPAPANERPLAGERTLLGAVLGESGPLPGAQVLVIAEGDPVAETDSDAAGRFEIRFPVPIDTAVLRILARGYAPLERPLGSPRRPGQEHLGNLTVLRGSVLTGTVVDDGGRPVVGVDVGMGLWSGDYEGARILERMRTGPEGVFRFANAPSGRITLTVRAEGWADRTVDHTHGTGQDARIELVRASQLRMQVLDPSGQGVPQATVEVQRTDRRGTAREEKTDAEGRVVFENLDAKTWSLRISKAGYRPYGRPSVIADGIEQRVEVVAWPCIAGLLTTPDGQAPPAGSRVVALPGGMRGDVVQLGAGGTPVQADGRFRLCDLRPGSYVVQAIAPGFAPTMSHAVQVQETGDLELGTLKLLEGGNLSLELTCGGKPLAKVEVEVLRSQPVPAQVWMESTATAEALYSDAQGRLTLENLGPGEVWLILRGPSTVPRLAGPFRMSEGRDNEPPPIELVRGTRVSGRVLLADGTSAGRARILLTGSDASAPIFADDSGQFLLPTLPPGRYGLQAQLRQGNGTVESSVQDLVLDGEEPTATVDLRFD